jgi:hypothetical protein
MRLFLSGANERMASVYRPCLIDFRLRSVIFRAICKTQTYHPAVGIQTTDVIREGLSDIPYLAEFVNNYYHVGNHQKLGERYEWMLDDWAQEVENEEIMPQLHNAVLFGMVLAMSDNDFLALINPTLAYLKGSLSDLNVKYLERDILEGIDKTGAQGITLENLQLKASSLTST